MIPLCDDVNATTSIYNETWVNFGIPPAESNDFLKEADDFHKCKTYALRPGSTECHADSFDKNVTVACEEYWYDRSTFEATAVTDLDLVCGDGYKAKFQGTILMMGLLFGCVVGGPLADKMGRKMALTAALGVLGPSTIIGGFIPNYAAFSIFRFLSLTSISVIWISGHTYLMELFDAKWRKLAYVLNMIWYGLSAISTPLIAYLERDWKFMHLWSGLVVVIAFPVVAVFLEESIRWNILNGKSDAAEKQLLSAGRVNKGLDMHEDEVHEIRHVMKVMAIRQARTGIHAEKKLSPLDMFSRRYLLVTLITLSIWVTSIVSFYALALNSTSLAGDIFANQIFSLLSELPVTFVVYLLIDLIGRRYTMAGSLLMGGSCCIAMGFVPKDQSGAVLALYLLGKAGSTCCLNVAWFYTAEIYPTNMRAQAIATCSLVGRVVGAFAPFIVDLSVYSEIIPFLVVGVPVLLSGLAALALPETKGQSLPEAIETNEKEDYKCNEGEAVESLDVKKYHDDKF
jgi:MFS family permease